MHVQVGMLVGVQNAGREMQVQVGVPNAGREMQVQVGVQTHAPYIICHVRLCQH